MHSFFIIKKTNDDHEGKKMQATSKIDYFTEIEILSLV